ncbi:MAG: hypothetical protein QHG97_01540 [Methanolinea sp.]|jgi:hypothetical protein|nr:hypothetical protein [Methanolinea sp.]
MLPEHDNNYPKDTEHLENPDKLIINQIRDLPPVGKRSPTGNKEVKTGFTAPTCSIPVGRVLPGDVGEEKRESRPSTEGAGKGSKISKIGKIRLYQCTFSRDDYFDLHSVKEGISGLG